MVIKHQMHHAWRPSCWYKHIDCTRIVNPLSTTDITMCMYGAKKIQTYTGHIHVCTYLVRLILLFDSSIAFMQPIHTCSTFSPTSQGYMYIVASFTDCIRTSSSFFLFLPLTFEVFLSSSVNRLLTKFAEKFTLEQLFDLIAAKNPAEQVTVMPASGLLLVVGLLSCWSGIHGMDEITGVLISTCNVC